MDYTWLFLILIVVVIIIIAIWLNNNNNTNNNVTLYTYKFSNNSSSDARLILYVGKTEYFNGIIPSQNYINILKPSLPLKIQFMNKVNDNFSIYADNYNESYDTIFDIKDNFAYNIRNLNLSSETGIINNIVYHNNTNDSIYINVEQLSLFKNINIAANTSVTYSSSSSNIIDQSIVEYFNGVVGQTFNYCISNAQNCSSFNNSFTLPNSNTVTFTITGSNNSYNLTVIGS